MRNPIAFSTLACPEWSVETVIAKAAAFGYDGLEWRGGPQGHIRPTASAGERAALRQASAEAGLAALAVTAYTSFTSDNPIELQSNVGDLCRYADLAADIGAQYVRAFLGEIPVGANPSAAMCRNMATCLSGAAAYAATVGVAIALEPHDDFVRTSVVAPILSQVPDPALAVVWDLGNTFAAGEDPEEGFGLLGQRLAYVQVKDGWGRGASWTLCPVGEGEVPLARAFNLLLSNGYTGAFSVEWERAWHSELDPPEVALPLALRKIRSWLAAG